MTAHMRIGIRRLTWVCSAVAAAYVVIIELLGDFFAALLLSIEQLSDTHGLSGAVFLVLSPFAFLAACFAVDWIVAGFKGRPGRASVTPSAAGNVTSGATPGVKSATE